MTSVRNIVLVHGGFVDGSGWRGVYDVLTADGFNVSVVQNQTLSLDSDVATTTNVLDELDGPAILVGHSYGGAVITEAGTHGSVAGLVYVTAFAPDAGESVNSLIGTFPQDGPVPPILPPQDGFLFLDRDKFAEAFAADLPAPDAAFMADSQVPWGVEALNGEISEPAWRAKPSWYLIGSDDPAAGAAHHVRARRRDRHPGARQPLHLRLQPGRRRGPDRPGRTVPRSDRQPRLTTPGGRQDTLDPVGHTGIAGSMANHPSGRRRRLRRPGDRLQCSPGSSQLTRISDE